MGSREGTGCKYPAIGGARGDCRVACVRNINITTSVWGGRRVRGVWSAVVHLPRCTASQPHPSPVHTPSPATHPPSRFVVLVVRKDGAVTIHSAKTRKHCSSQFTKDCIPLLFPFPGGVGSAKRCRIPNSKSTKGCPPHFHRTQLHQDEHTTKRGGTRDAASRNPWG